MLIRCKQCQDEKPITAFYKDGKRADGTPRYRKECKECYVVNRAGNKKEAAKSVSEPPKLTKLQSTIEYPDDEWSPK
jgi:hypothetical protein